MTPLDQLRQIFNDASLSQLLIASKQSVLSAREATDLQLELETAWLKNSVGPELVFHYLMLDRSRNGIFSNPEFSSWARYLIEIVAKIPRQTL